MNYEQTLDFLYNALPMYQRVGPMAFKKDLTNTIKLCAVLGNPQDKFKSVHVAGTNGKGSSSHSIAAVLQTAGYKVGLYTSPHLKSFTERVRINGSEIPKEAVVDFVTDNKAAIEEIKPSFFEITVALAFDHFAKEQVDIAIIEVGLGGRLDSTNVIRPEVSLITNIGLDHTEMLGNSLQEIAFEKAGIIKKGIPVVVGTTQSETTPVFQKRAKDQHTEIIFADQQEYDLSKYRPDLQGSYHLNNLPGVLESLRILKARGFSIQDEHIDSGLFGVCALTGLKGRWQKLNDSPLTICDTGHNADAFHFIIDQIETQEYEQLHMVMGFVDDKNVTDLLKQLPQKAKLYFCQANVPRAMDLTSLRRLAAKFYPEATYIKDVNEALNKAEQNADRHDMIFIGGSTFVVAELNNL